MYLPLPDMLLVGLRPSGHSQPHYTTLHIMGSSSAAVAAVEAPLPSSWLLFKAGQCVPDRCNNSQHLMRRMDGLRRLCLSAAV